MKNLKDMPMFLMLMVFLGITVPFLSISESIERGYGLRQSVIDLMLVSILFLGSIGIVVKLKLSRLVYLSGLMIVMSWGLYLERESIADYIFLGWFFNIFVVSAVAGYMFLGSEPRKYFDDKSSG